MTAIAQWGKELSLLSFCKPLEPILLALLEDKEARDCDDRAAAAADSEDKTDMEDKDAAAIDEEEAAAAELVDMADNTESKKVVSNQKINF